MHVHLKQSKTHVLFTFHVASPQKEMSEISGMQRCQERLREFDELFGSVHVREPVSPLEWDTALSAITNR